MGRLADTAGVPGRSEDGWTLIELLVALTIGMVVLAGAVTVFIGAVRSEPRTSSKVSAVQEGRIAVERMTRELRQGIEVLDEPAPTATQIALLTYVKQATCGGLPSGTAIPCQVTYECEADACTRVVEAPDGSSVGTPTQVVSGLESTDVFTYSPNATEPAYVDVELTFETREGGPVVVSDGVGLRNGAL